MKIVIKAFFLALAVFVVITFITSLIAALITNSFDIMAMEDYLLGSIKEVPPLAINLIIVTSFSLSSPSALGTFIYNIGALAACISAAVVAGWFCGGGKKDSFSSWYLIAILSTVIIYIVKITIKNQPVLTEITDTLVYGLVNGIFYSAIAMLVNPEHY